MYVVAQSQSNTIDNHCDVMNVLDCDTVHDHEHIGAYVCIGVYAVQ